MSELNWQLRALRIHAKLQPAETDPDNNLLKELDKDYGMFEDVKHLHMRNINEKLTLNDVVSFHEIIEAPTKAERDLLAISPTGGHHAPKASYL